MSRIAADAAAVKPVLGTSGPASGRPEPAPAATPPAAPADPCFIKVAFPLPLEESYWYKVDPGTPDTAGRRVEVPLGRRTQKGFVVGQAKSCPIDPKLLKPVGRVIDDEPLYSKDTVELGQWVASMYFCSLGEALGAMLPTGRRESREPSSEIEEFSIGEKALELNFEQAAALDAILASRAGTHYLFGPTGTGKTEVFLQAAEKTMAEKRSVIYLVPEIALTGQVVRQARKRFGGACAVIHSRLTPSRKLTEWRRILKGEARMVIGARSAVFAPLPDLGLIVIDEEHEGSYKSGSNPRYHARQVAMRRASISNARLVLGSATPSLEAWQACETGSMARETLVRRPGGGSFPAVEIIDMRSEADTISKPLAQALEATKAEGRQSILFLNRRGFSHFFACNTCGAELICKNCSVALTYHKEQNQLVCHYCGYRTSPPTACPECSSLDVGWRGFGTERVEEELKTRWPEWKIGRLDADSVSRKGVLESTLEQFGKGEIDLLVGTQMVAKGLNFPGVKTVGLIMADAGLNLPDFRAAERVFSLIVQVSGRAGRRDADGTVYLQTYRPDHPVIQAAAARDIEGFYARELAFREEQGFPPYSRLARFVLRSRSRERCVMAARELAARGRAAGTAGAEILGPSECALGMIAGTHRWQVLVRASGLPTIRRAAASAIDGWKLPPQVRLELDIDPVQFL
ncbi:MAG: primosomal protein N' [Spirochaetes bacterium]|nr:primosomal protein N' [Spirochaetota bacterium]